MIQVDIELALDQGWVKYDEKEKEVSVFFPNLNMQRRVKKYLITKREFIIPESQQMDDFRIDNKKPTDGLTYFYLAMSTLMANIGPRVDWSSEREV